MSNEIKLEGTVETVLPLETFDSGFTKRVLVINTGGDYPQTVPVEFTKDKTDLLTGLVKGQRVVAAINIRGNEYKGKYYCNLGGWRLDKGGEVTTAASPGGSTPSVDSSDDIPFAPLHEGF
jgi:single-strand DNA-binding protein